MGQAGRVAAMPAGRREALGSCRGSRRTGTSVTAAAIGRSQNRHLASGGRLGCPVRVLD